MICRTKCAQLSTLSSSAGSAPEAMYEQRSDIADSATKRKTAHAIRLLSATIATAAATIPKENTASNKSGDVSNAIIRSSNTQADRTITVAGQCFMGRACIVLPMSAMGSFAVGPLLSVSPHKQPPAVYASDGRLLQCLRPVTGVRQTTPACRVPASLDPIYSRFR